MWWADVAHHLRQPINDVRPFAHGVAFVDELNFVFSAYLCALDGNLSLESIYCITTEWARGCLSTHCHLFDNFVGPMELHRVLLNARAHTHTHQTLSNMCQSTMVMVDDAASKKKPNFSKDCGLPVSSFVLAGIRIIGIWNSQGLWCFTTREKETRNKSENEKKLSHVTNQNPWTEQIFNSAMPHHSR